MANLNINRARHYYLLRDKRNFGGIHTIDIEHAVQGTALVHCAVNQKPLRYAVALLLVS